MAQINILVYLTSVEQTLKVVRFCEKEYLPVVANSFEEIPPILQNYDCWAMIVDSSFASYDRWKELITPDCSVIILGRQETEIYQNLLTWPAHYHLEYVLEAENQPLEPILSQILKVAIHHSRIKREWTQLQQTISLNSASVREVFQEISEIKRLINEHYLRELERRITLEARYVWAQRERWKIENIIRKIYSANDVSSLLGVVPDIKDLIQAQGLTIYLIEESETLGRHLKPIIWDDTFITHPETFKYVARLDAPDFAAAVARHGQEINISDLTYDKRFSLRYQHNLKTPLKSILAAPIVYGDQIIGVIELYNKHFKGSLLPEGFSREDQQIMRGLSEHIGIAMTKLNLIQYDPLTGLLRAEPFFDKILQKVNSMSKRRVEECAFAMVMGDVDWFKHYNDRNGHEAGNRLLQELATVLKQSVRENDLICRYGGEEFLFFLGGVSTLEEACQLTERIRQNIEDHYFPYEEFQPRNNLTMSFGVTIFPRQKIPGDGKLTREDLKHLVHECDLALAEAKDKETWRLPPSEAQSRPATKNTVVAFSGDWETENHLRPTVAYQEKLFKEKRHFQRHYTSTILMYRDDGQLRVCKTINLSLGGAKVLSEKPLPAAGTMDIILILGKKAHPLKSEVVYSEKASPDSATFYYGLKFKELTGEDFRILEGYFQDIQKDTFN
ncbi:MAG: diguanylate cyclase [Candidatus Saccharicenans sp.]|uniref:diguanylate cyclase n=1 Tax=Candidatus Saccharicenans sp. TaxID=2819258 RepID=UPI004049F2BE